jgi:hypothetical protein
MNELPIRSSSEGARFNSPGQRPGATIGIDIISPNGAKFAGIATDGGLIAETRSCPVGALHAVDGHDTQACGLGYRIGPRWGWKPELGHGTVDVEVEVEA